MAAPADQTKLRKRLEVLLKQPDNQVCSDCNKRGPRWASANLGIFFCIECSGIHRNLGVHISFVRSVNLDSWTNKQVEFMEEWGNGRANAYWEANLPPHVHKPKEGDTVRTIEKFIRDKYEHKRYVASSVPERTSNAVPAAAASAPASTHNSAKAAPASNNNGRSFVYDDEEPQEAAPVAPARRAAPQAAPAPAPVAAKPAAAPVDLLNFLDEPAPSPATVTSNGSSPFAPTAASSVFGFEATQAAPQQAQQAQHQHDAFGGDFSAFQSAPTQQHQQHQGQAPQQAQFSNGFGFDSFGPQDSLTAPVPAAAPQAAAPARPQASADSILSLFAAPAPAYGQQYPPQGGIYSPHQAASPYGMPPQHQHQQQGFYPQQGYGQQSASPFPGQAASPYPAQGASPFPQQAASPFPGTASPYSPYPAQGGYPQQQGQPQAQAQGQYGQHGYGQPQAQGYPPQQQQQQQQQFNQFPQNGWR